MYNFIVMIPRLQNLTYSVPPVLLYHEGLAIVTWDGMMPVLVGTGYHRCSMILVLVDRTALREAAIKTSSAC